MRTTIEQIKVYRVELDRLSKLANEVSTTIYAIDLTKLPKNIKGDEFIAYLSSTGIIPILSENEGVIDETPLLEPLVQSNWIHQAYLRILLAKAHCGSILGLIGEPTPYSNDGNRKEIKDIEPTSDSYLLQGNQFPIEVSNHIQRVDYLREECKSLLSKLSEIYKQYGKDYDIKFAKVYSDKDGDVDKAISNHQEIEDTFPIIKQYIKEARFMFGFQLGEIRDSKRQPLI